MLSYSELREQLLSGFYGFWVKNYRIGIMLVVLIGLLGISNLLSIPKESSPDIKFGIIQIGTVYTGVAPEEIDSLITSRIEKEIQSIQGVDKIESSSREWFSNVVVTLTAEANTDKVLQQIKDGVWKAKLPTDATEPAVTEISTDSQQLFSVFLANTNRDTPRDALMKAARDIQKRFEGNYNIESVTIDGGDTSELEVIILGEKLDALGISTSKIADIVKSYNQSFPLGSFTIDTKKYDLRIEGDVTSFEELLRIPVGLSEGGSVPLGEFATIQRKWTNTAIERMNIGEYTDIPFVRLNFNKEPRKSVFETSTSVRTALDEYMKTLWSEWKIDYGLDLAAVITQDYKDLASNAIQTIILVYICIFFFIGLRESLIASLSIPLAFLISIMTLNMMGLSLNFMTNFSLILSFGIAIDLTLVIIEETTKKCKMWYNPATAVLLAVKELKLSVISSTAVTLIVFVPMMLLPGIIGKFLAYIPLTVFSSLLATLFLSMTTNSSVFIKLAKPGTTYVKQPLVEAHLPPDEVLLLEEERKGKQERPAESESRREKLIEGVEAWYEKTLKWWLETKKRRLLVIWWPVLLTILTFIFLSPRLVGGGLFPTEDSQYVFLNIIAPPGTKQSSLLEKINTGGVSLEERFVWFPEIKLSAFTISEEKVSIFLELTDTAFRKANNQRTSQELEKIFLKNVTPLLGQWLSLDTNSVQNWPPTGKPVSIKLIADSTDKLTDLKRVSKEFESFIKNIEGVKNVTNTSADSPGEIIFTVDRERAASVGISPLQIYSEISAESRGVKAGSITLDDEDIDIIVKTDTHYDELQIDKIQSIQIPTANGPVMLGSLLKYQIWNAIVDVRRVDGDLTISVEADTRDGYVGGQLLSQLNAYAEKYQFPKGISYKKWGEFEANKELITGAFTALISSILLIFVILVFVFNSYSQPLIILYTIILGLLGVNFGLWFMKFFDPSIGYNMPMGIGFISLNGLVVTNAIILLDKINRNRDAGMKPYDTVIDGGKTRMIAQVVTALTTVFGLLPTAFQDPFWAGLSWTVIWGTVVATVLTLYCIPALYYEAYLHEGDKKTTKRRGNIFQSLISFVRKKGKKYV
jgi:multidrug efflux pump subunit AcrB